jgi:phosphate/sulfate permease
MKTHQPELAHTYQWRSRFRPTSLSHSLIMATVVGVIVAAVGIALFALSRYLQVPWHIAAATGGIGQVIIVSVLVLIVLEQRRKRSIRLAQEFTFLNHHIQNAITQITMASYLDLDKQQRMRGEALERISGALRRIANSADLDGLSLEVDLTGSELAREGADRGDGVEKKTA